MKNKKIVLSACCIVVLAAVASAGETGAPRFEPLRSETVGSISTPAPQVVTTPSDFSLTIDGDFNLGGFVFKEGYAFLHNEGGYGKRNTALGLNALVNVSPLYGSRNTALGCFPSAEVGHIRGSI
jgi:hypothetical protein